MLPPEDCLQEDPGWKGCGRVGTKSCGHTSYQTLPSTQELRMTLVADDISCVYLELARQGYDELCPDSWSTQEHAFHWK